MQIKLDFSAEPPLICPLRPPSTRRFKRRSSLKNNFFGALLLFAWLAPSTCMFDPYSKRYAPFQVITQAQLLRPSVPFPGIFEFSTPKAQFFAKVRSSENAEPVLKPQLSKDFGKKRYVHYNSDIFVPNEGIDFLSLRKNFDYKQMTSEMLAKVLEEQLATLGSDLDFPLEAVGRDDKAKADGAKLPKYYEKLFDEYDPSIQFYDEYSRDDYYIDMLKFLNKMKNSVDFYSTTTSDPNSEYYHDLGKLIVKKLNSYRRSQKLRDNVIWSEPMYYYVMEHSVYMSRIRDLTHDGFSTRSRYVRRMYPVKASSENLASFQSFSLLGKEDIAERFMKLWINSEGHRLNMEKDFNMCSVAIYKTQNEEYYATMFLIKV